MKISIRKKIIITFLILFFISISISIFGFYNYNKLNHKISLIEKKRELLNYILEARRYEKNFFIKKDKKALKHAINFLEKADSLFVLISKEIGKYAESSNIQEHIRLVRDYKSALILLLNKIKHSSVIDPKEIELVRQKGHNLTATMENAINREKGAIKGLLIKSKTYLYLSIISMVGVTIIILIFLLINVNRPLKQIENAIKRIIIGDYEAIPRIKTGDEFERLALTLNKLLSEMKKRSEQLVQSEKMAALGTLTSGVAHELNNPLNNISTSLQIVLEELDEGDIEYQRDLLKESLIQVDRAQDIVKSLLEFSRETTFSTSEESILDLVKNTLKLVQGEVPSNVSILVDVPEDLKAMVDPRRMQQVFLNLILNAIQAMEKQGGEIHIRAKKDEKRKGIVIEIEDNGPGIPEDILPKIFDPFFTTKKVGKGSGLGLSVSQGIIAKHGGEISVKSEVGKGTCFTIFLPFKSKN